MSFVRAFWSEDTKILSKSGNDQNACEKLIEEAENQREAGHLLEQSFYH